MADDLSIVASLLRDTNKKLDKLSKDNDENNTATSIIAQSLPEILSDRNIQAKSQKFDKKEGVTEVDEAVAETTKAVREGNAEAAAQAAEDAAKAAKERIEQAKERIETRKANEAWKHLDIAQWDSIKGFAENSEENRKDQKSHIEDLKTVNEEVGKEIEEQGGVAKANSEYVKGSFDIQMAEFALRKKNPELSRAGKSELARETSQAKKEQRTTNGLMRRMAGGILTSLKNTGKAVGLGILGFLSVLGLSAFLYALGQFLGSEQWKEMVDKLKGFHNAFFGKDGSFMKGIKELFSDIDGLGGIIIGIGTAAALFVGFKITRLVLAVSAFLSAIGVFSKKLPGAAPPTTKPPKPPKPPIPMVDKEGRQIGKDKKVLKGAALKSRMKKLAQGRPTSNWKSKIKGAGKILGRAGGGILGAALDLSTIDWSQSKEKILPELQGVLAGLAGGAIAGLVGGLFTGGFGTFLAGTAGYYAGKAFMPKWVTETLAKRLLGIDVDESGIMTKYRGPQIKKGFTLNKETGEYTNKAGLTAMGSMRTSFGTDVAIHKGVSKKLQGKLYSLNYDPKDSKRAWEKKNPLAQTGWRPWMDKNARHRLMAKHILSKMPGIMPAPGTHFGSSSWEESATSARRKAMHDPGQDFKVIPYPHLNSDGTPTVVVKVAAPIVNVPAPIVSVLNSGKGTINLYGPLNRGP
jgi:hypothetical protein